MAGVFVAQKPMKVAILDDLNDMGVKVGEIEIWRQAGEVVPEADMWLPGALDSALARGELVHVSQESIDNAARMVGIEARLTVLEDLITRSSGSKKGSS